MDSPLRKARLRRGLALRTVGRSVGLDAGSLSRIENGLQKARPKLAERLACYFGHELSEIQILYPERYNTEKN